MWLYIMRKYDPIYDVTVVKLQEDKVFRIINE